METVGRREFGSNGLRVESPVAVQKTISDRELEGKKFDVESV